VEDAHIIVWVGGRWSVAAAKNLTRTWKEKRFCDEKIMLE